MHVITYIHTIMNPTFTTRINHELKVFKQAYESSKDVKFRVHIEDKIWYILMENFPLASPYDTSTTDEPNDISPFHGGQYLFKIIMTDFPFKAPNFQFMTPNGRFLLNINICMTGITTFYGSDWRPSNNIHSVCVNFAQYFVDYKNPDSYVHDGHYDYNSSKKMPSKLKQSPELYARLAAESAEYNRTNFADIMAKFDTV